MSNNPVLYTIGFAKKDARTFFEMLRAAKVRKVIDVRLNNVSQLAGFTKKNDIRYFLEKILECGYEHRPDWAPTADILDPYKKGKTTWDDYVRDFSVLMERRKIGSDISAAALDHCCLLCSEPTPEQCHRRLVAERLQCQCRDLRVIHLKTVL